MDRVSKIMNQLDDIEYGFKDEIDPNSNYETFVYKYRQPKYHLSCNEFYDYIKTQKRIDI